MALFQSKKAENIQQAPSSGAVPHHVAIIMDGNGRWAKARGLPRIAGHKKGSDALREILKGCKGLGVDYLTIYAFSSENWRRPEEEVKELMGLLRLYLNSEIKTLHENKINLKIIGDLSRLSDDIRTDIENAELLTANNTEFYLQVALSYGSRQELLTAMKRVAEDVSSGTLQADAITEQTVAERLYTGSAPDPDLLIRTGGEKRLSNFLLWQSAYTELYFTDVLWPDFTLSHFEEAIKDYSQRERRYGTTGA